MDDLPKFEMWERDRLENFAYDAYRKLQEMHYELEEMQMLARVTQDKYVALLRRTSDDWK